MQQFHLFCPQVLGALVELRPTKLSRVKRTKVFPDQISLFSVGFFSVGWLRVRAATQRATAGSTVHNKTSSSKAHKKTQAGRLIIHTLTEFDQNCLRVINPLPFYL
jgi:hypothetical protein